MKPISDLDTSPDENAHDDGLVDPHLHGSCCHACGFAAELEKSGVPPPVPGKKLMFPMDAAGVPRGAAIIVRQSGQERDADVIDVTTREVLIGRVDDNHVVLAKPNISKRQMRITFSDGVATVADMKSCCGSWVNGKRITVPQALCEGDKMYVGDFTLELVRIP